MFQFTTTNVINSDKDVTTGKDLYLVKDDALIIKRIGTFKKANVAAIYKAAATDAENAKACVLMSDLGGKEGDVFRLDIYLGLTQGSADSRFSNDLAVKGKPLSIEFEWTESDAVTLENLKKIITNYSMLVYGDKLLNVETTSTALILEAVNEYIRFKKFVVEKFDKGSEPYPYPYTGTYTKVKDVLETKKDTAAEVDGIATAYFAGKEGFGTYPFLLHNLRIPTDMRTRAFAPNQDETPVVGAKYNQYTIHYCVNRGPLGLNAVGDTVKSVTTHVLYVRTDLATAFETELAKIGTITEAKKGAADPVIPVKNQSTSKVVVDSKKG